MAIAIAMVLACIAILFFPHQAQAKSYEMPKVSIAAEAQTDGSLHVVEARTFEFNGDFTAVWWTFSDLPSNAKLVVNGVHLSFDSAKGEAGSIFDAGSSGSAGSSANSDSSTSFDANQYDGSSTNFDIDLPSVSFRESWRDEGGPGTEAYSFDEQQNTVYAFFDASDETITVTLDYTVENGVQAYKDVAEVYWKYVGDGWEEASCDVSMTLTLPVASGASVVPGNTVRAWGHGPLDGVVSVGDDGTVTYTVPKVKAGQYAEARVLFPVAWLTNLSGKAAQLHKDTARLDTVLSEESVWADQANRQRVLSLALVVACGVVCALLLVWALWLYFKCGKEHKPDFTGKYWRNIPDRPLHPAVVGRLWRWNREDSVDFTTTLINLSRIGAICIDRGSQGGGRVGSGQAAGSQAVGGQVGSGQAVGQGGCAWEASAGAVSGQIGSGQVVGEYRIMRLPEAESVATNPVDQAALTFLFDTVAGGRAWLWSGDIGRYGESHAKEFVDGMKTWQDVLSAEVDARGFFEPKSSRWQVRMIVVAVMLFLLGVAISVSQDNFVPLIFVVPTSIVLAVLANYMPRRSVYGNNVVAKCKALRNWLRDFSSLGERLPADARIWGEFMLYAYVFGIAGEVMGQLHISVPQLFGEDASGYDASYVPWWLWYEAGYSGTNGMVKSVVGSLQESVSSTIDAAQAAIFGSSDGSGGGGGFSGGGGGGFGGGGGAR